MFLLCFLTGRICFVIPCFNVYKDLEFQLLSIDPFSDLDLKLFIINLMGFADEMV